MFINNLIHIFKEPNIHNTFICLSHLIQCPSESDVINAFRQMKTCGSVRSAAYLKLSSTSVQQGSNPGLLDSKSEVFPPIPHCLSERVEGNQFLSHCLLDQARLYPMGDTSQEGEEGGRKS